MLRYDGPKVTLIASTQAHPFQMLAAAEELVNAVSSGTDAELLSEFAGRNCYQSWANPAGRTTQQYLQDQIVGHEHFSVIEHASATFHISGVSRSLLAELTRHRHLSFSVLSQRYVDESEAPMIVPPDIATDPDLDGELRMVLELVDSYATDAYRSLIQRLENKPGWDRKRARSAARAVLPQMTETQIVVTGNHRTWREVIQKRSSPGADTEIRNLAGALLTQLHELAPSLYEDLLEDKDS